MKQKFKIEDIEFELDIIPGNCDECYYENICVNMKSPVDDENDFQDFCMDYIENEVKGGPEIIPAPGTLEESIPFIFPDIILDKIKENKEIKDTLNNYCEFFCSFECISECPLKKYKKK